jgi:hypothetical protein
MSAEADDEFVGRDGVLLAQPVTKGDYVPVGAARAVKNRLPPGLVRPSGRTMSLRPFLSRTLRAVGGDRRVDAGGGLRGRHSGVVHGRGGRIRGAFPVLKAGAYLTTAGGCACGVGDGDTGNL